MFVKNLILKLSVIEFIINIILPSPIFNNEFVIELSKKMFGSFLHCLLHRRLKLSFKSLNEHFEVASKIFDLLLTFIKSSIGTGIFFTSLQRVMRLIFSSKVNLGNYKIFHNYTCHIYNN